MPGSSSGLSLSLNPARDNSATPMVLINPRSFRMGMKNRGYRLRELLKRHDLPSQIVEDDHDIRQGVEEGLALDNPLLIVIGGDGTLQAAVTHLASLKQTRLPDLLVLGGGRTNYTARDLGTQNQLITTLTAALEQPASFHRAKRTTLHVLQEDGLDQHGFFVAGGLVDWIIRDCHAYRAGGTGPLRTGHLSSVWRILQLGAKALIGRPGYKAIPLTLSLDEGLNTQQNNRLFLATTLEHQDDWPRPYQMAGSGAVRVTAIDRAAARFWTRIPRLLNGRYHPAMTPQKGYLSQQTRGATLSGFHHISLDGQEYSVCPDRPLRLQTGLALNFLTR